MSYIPSYKTTFQDLNMHMQIHQEERKTKIPGVRVLHLEIHIHMQISSCKYKKKRKDIGTKTTSPLIFCKYKKRRSTNQTEDSFMVCCVETVIIKA